MSERRTSIRVPPGKQSGFRIKTVGQAWTPHQDLYHFVLTRPWWQFFGITTALYLAINGVFSLLYLIIPGSITNARAGSFEDAFYFSVQTMSTIGYGGMVPATRTAHLFVILEAISGMLFMALVTGITYAKFARPTSRVLFTDKAVIGTRDGQPLLMFRMANFRHNVVTEAKLRVNLLVTEVSSEGEMLRRFYEIPLIRSETSLFSLTWIAMHPITPSSPFYGDEALDRLKTQEAEIFLSLTGLDGTLVQTIHASYRYGLKDLVWGARFADVMTTLKDGTRVLDYTHFHDVVMMAAPIKFES